MNDFYMLSILDLSGVDNSIIWKLAGQVFLILLAIAVVAIIYNFIRNKIVDILGYNQQKEKNTSTTKTTKKTTKKRAVKDENKNLREVVRGILAIAGLYLFFQMKLDWPYFFGIIFVAGILPDILIRPKRKTSSKSSSSKPTKSPTTKKFKNKLTDQELLTTPIEEMSGTDFERLVTKYYAEKGYKPHIVGGAGDHEVDLILTDPKENYKIAVQCKRWKTKNVGNDTILRLSAGKRVHKCLDAWCITTSNYTTAAKEAAEGSKIRIFNGLHVQETIGKWQKNKAKQKTS